MPDRPKSTLPADPTPADVEESIGFHETLLTLFQPEDAAALRRVGKLLYSLVLEGDSPNFGGEGESVIGRELNAALVDAVSLRDYLWAIGQQIGDNELVAGDAQLSLFAREQVYAMDRIIDAMQEALK